LSHPAWTGGPQKLGDRGQVSKFQQKFGAFGLKKG
ncbi:MAG: 50S ribosomal protein L31, partial [Parvularculaceae bacterium]|nr:50S ribosomal protein L31 [Parvularculaceae bacterium]